MKPLCLALLVLFFVAGCKNEPAVEAAPPLDPALISTCTLLYGPLYDSLRDSYKRGTESMRGDVAPAVRKSAGPKIVKKLEEAVVQLDALKKNLSGIKDPYAIATTTVVTTLRGEAVLYISYAQKAQTDDPAADPAFMSIAQQLEPTAQIRVRAVQHAQEVFDELSDKQGLIRPKPLL